MSLLRRRMMMLSEQEDDEMAKEWKLIYDSGEIEEEMIRTTDIAVNGMTELYIIGKINISENTIGTRSCTIYVTDDENVEKQLVLGNNAIANSGNPRAFCTHVQKIDDLVISKASTSLNAPDIFNGATIDNLNAYGCSAAKAGNMKKIYITNLNYDRSYFFGVGSRFAVYGR